MDWDAPEAEWKALMDADGTEDWRGNLIAARKANRYDCDFILCPCDDDTAEAQAQYLSGRGWNWRKLLNDYGLDEVHESLEAMEMEMAIRWEKSLARWLKREKGITLELRCTDY